MFTYYLAVILSTIYFIFLSLVKIQALKRLRQYSRYEKWIDAFNGSVSTFVDTALLFSISMLVAATYRHASSLIHPDKTNSIYGLMNSTYLSAFSIFPPLLLQTLAKDLRRRRIRLTLWFVVIILALSVAGIYYKLTRSPDRLEHLLFRDAGLTQLIWLTTCAPLAMDELGTVLTVAQVLLGLNISWWIYCAAMGLVHYRREPGTEKSSPRIKTSRLLAQWKKFLGKSKRLRRFQDMAHIWIPFVNGFACCVMMWALLGPYTAFRKSVFDTMGDSNLDNSWSFGQVLALLTWVPVVIDFVTIRMCEFDASFKYPSKLTSNMTDGELIALQGKLPQGYRIVPVSDHSTAQALLDIGARHPGV